MTVWFVFGLLVWSADVSTKQHHDTPFWQDESVPFVPEVDLNEYELRTIRVDRDGRVLINTNNGLLMPFDGRIVRYEEMQGIKEHDHLDLELLRGKFVFLTPKFLLPVHGAGADYFANEGNRYSRVGVLAPGRYLLLKRDGIALLDRGRTKSFANEHGATEIVVDPDSGAVYLWAKDSIGLWSPDGRITPLSLPSSVIRGVLPDGPQRVIAATEEGAYVCTVNETKPLPNKLPVSSLTRVARDSRGWLWFGSTEGAFRITPEGRLSYYYGRRWLPDNHVLDLTEDSQGDVWILTKGGVAKIDFELMTLARKAELFEQKIRRHHIRFGLVADTHLPDGDYAKLRMHDSDNDGLWSSMYGASEAFRYVVTREESARENFMDTFDAIERLVTITRIPGFQARSFEIYGFKQADRDAWRERPEKDFDWKGTTSSDELVGTIFFYCVAYETVGQQDSELKDRIAKLVGSIVGHIVDNDFYYIDSDGQPTRWGFWNPRNINSPASLHDRRLNSIEMLGFLGFAYEVTKDEKFRKAFDELVDRHGYAENTVRYLPNPMGPWNHSDDELYWLSYYFLLKYPLRESLLPTFQQSAKEHFEANARKRNPLWNIIYGARTGRPIDLEGAVFWLQEFPMDRRSWRMKNSHRQDIQIAKRLFVPAESDPVLPPDERRVHKWNSNEMDLDGGGNGSSAESGAEYLLPFWMGRHFGYISAPAK